MKLWWLSYSWLFQTTAMVVRADSEDEARRMARTKYAAQYEYRDPKALDGWLDPKESECIELVGAGEAGVVIAGWQ